MAVLTEQAPQRDPRTSVMLSVELFRLGDTTPSRHRVVNISTSGICIGQAADVPPNTAVSVSIGEVQHAAADVVWQRGGNAGLRFRTPIDVPAARRRRPNAVLAPPAAGWLSELNEPYNRR